MADGDRLLEQLSLADKRNHHLGHVVFCGGPKQRLFIIALALVNDPEVVFLDEADYGTRPPLASRDLGIMIAGAYASAARRCF